MPIQESRYSIGYPLFYIQAKTSKVSIAFTMLKNKNRIFCFWLSRIRSTMPKL